MARNRSTFRHDTRQTRPTRQQRWQHAFPRFLPLTVTKADEVVRSLVRFCQRLLAQPRQAPRRHSIRLASHHIAAIEPLEARQLLAANLITKLDVNVAELVTAGLDASDNFGYSVTLAGDTLAVGARNDETSTAGSVYVFDRDTGGDNSWGLVAKLDETVLAAAGLDLGDRFGSSVTLAGDTLAVGARSDETTYAGSVYLFDRDQGGANNWGLVTKLDETVLAAAGLDLGDRFGSSVTLAGDTLAVGARYDETGSAGSVYVFDRDTGGANNWGLVTKLDDSVPELAAAGLDFADHFGLSVTLTGDTLAVGASSDEAGLAGSVYVFDRDTGGANNWGLVTKLDENVTELAAAGLDAGDQFGYSVTLAGDTLAVGAYGDETGFAGSVYVFDRDTGGANSWGLVTKLDDSVPELAAAGLDGGDRFGGSVTLAGDTLAVGANEDETGFAGSVYVFDRDMGGANNWGLVTKLDDSVLAAAGLDAGDQFGYSVTLAGDTLAVGARTDETSAAGSVYVFDLNLAPPPPPALVTKLDENVPELAAAGLDGFDLFGNSVTLSGDTLAVGARYDETGYAGSVYVFDRDTGGANNWGLVTKLDENVTELAAAGLDGGDRFGISVTLAGDTLAVGASSDEAGLAGSVYVFDRDTGGANNWGLVTKLDENVTELAAAGLDGGDRFGGSVTLAGDTLAVGAFFDETGFAGSVYVFDRDMGGANNWGLVTKLDENVTELATAGLDGGDRFGGSVTLAGDTLAVAAVFDETGEAGSVYVFDRDTGGANNWGLVTKLDENVTELATAGLDGDDRFGTSVTLSGDTLAVGAHLDETGEAGSVYVFDRDTDGANNWGLVTKLDENVTELVTAGLDGGDRFGRSVTLAGDTLAVGANEDETGEAGSVYVFDRDTGGANNWGLVTKLDENVTELVTAGLDSSDFFGISVTLSGDTLAVGAAGDETGGAGSVYVFDLAPDVDTTDPVITCPDDVTIEADESTAPTNTGTATATDDIDPSVEITHSDVDTQNADPNSHDHYNYTITRTWLAEDDAGNTSSCDQTITVEDTTAPVITLPDDVTVEADQPSDSSNTGEATATDNADPDPTITEEDTVVAGTCPQEHVITRTWTATDATGNSDAGVQTITVVDTTAPVITAPDDVTVQEGDSTDPSNTGEATATDNADDDVTIEYDDHEPEDGTIIRTWTATDDCGNSTEATQTITIEEAVEVGPRIIDDGDPDYSQTGMGELTTGNGFENDLDYTGTNGAGTSTWTFDGLIVGQEYRVSASWFGHNDRATNARYLIDGIDDAGLSGTQNNKVVAFVNQRNAPNDFSASGANWEDLRFSGNDGIFTAASSTITVSLSAGTNGNVVADAVRIAPAKAQVIDDGDPDYSQTGMGQLATGNGFAGDLDHTGSNGPGVATWTFVTTPGNLYRVSATWFAHSTNRATNAPYLIEGIDDEFLSGINNDKVLVTVNQRNAPNDLSDVGANWEDLRFSGNGGVFEATGSTITISLSAGTNGNVVADAIRLEEVSPLHAETPAASSETVASETAALSLASANPLVDQAIAAWTAVDATAAARLADVQVQIVDLPQNVLGVASESTDTIWLDASGDGYGWNVTGGGSMDLLTVITHELGHVLGHADLDPHTAGGNIMSGSLSAGLRRLPGLGETTWAPLANTASDALVSDALASDASASRPLPAGLASSALWSDHHTETPSLLKEAETRDERALVRTPHRLATREDLAVTGWDGQEEDDLLADLGWTETDDSDSQAADELFGDWEK